MVNRLKPLNLFDFTGGVNLRPETFQLRDNELPELVNMEVDPRGGLNTRKGWTGFAPQVTTDPWNPRNAYAHTKSTGDRVWLVANDKGGGTGAVYSKLGAAAWTPIAGDATARPHIADFVAWGNDVYIARGSPNASVRWDGTTATSLTACAAGNWQNDYANPGGTNTFPYADLVEVNHGYMFVAGTTEDAVAQPNRIRWSHPNNPQRWAQADYIDITDGGQRITALVAFSDRLLIFKPDSVWALFGYDADTWEVANVSRTVGCRNQQVCARNESAVFFMSWPQGIFGYTDRGVTELSIPIRTVFEDRTLDPVHIDNSWLGWVGRRLWVSLPYWDELPPPNDASTVFVFDPALSDPGSWMMFRGAAQPTLPLVPGPYFERTAADQTTPLIACGRRYPYLLRLEDNADKAEDENPPGSPAPFTTRFRTRWMDAGAPTWRKSWRRPDFLLRGLTFDTKVNVQVFHDFDSYNAERGFMVAYTPDNFPAKYTATGLAEDGGFMWGDGTLYGGSEQSSSVERGGTMGRAGAIQIECVGEPSVVWGLNGIIFKFVPRRFR